MTRAVIVAHDGVLADEVRLASDVLQRLPGVRVVVAGPRRGALAAAGGTVVADVAHGEILLADVVVVPGMLGVASVANDEAFVTWLGAVVATAEWTLTLSVGGVAVAATGRVHGELATSWLARPLLERYGVTAAAERVTTEGRILSASGTVSAFDALVELCRRIAGDEVAASVIADVRAAAAAGGSDPSPRRRRWLTLRGSARLGARFAPRSGLGRSLRGSARLGARFAPRSGLDRRTGRSTEERP